MVERRALILVVLLTLVWGTNWQLFPLAVREVSVWTFRAFSLALAGSVLLTIARIRGQSLAIPRRHWATVCWAALCYMVVWNVASTYAAVLIPSGQAAVLGFTMPLWSALISWLVLGERLGARLVFALIVGGAGVGLLMVPALGAYADAPAGFALGLLAALGWAGGTLIIKRGAVGVPATVLTGWQLLLAAIPITLGAFALGDWNWFVPSWQTIVVVSYMTLIPMTIGNLLWFSIVGLLPANVAGLSSVMVPVVAMISGAIILGEPLGPLQVSAILCTVTSLALALLRPGAKPGAGRPR